MLVVASEDLMFASPAIAERLAIFFYGMDICHKIFAIVSWSI